MANSADLRKEKKSQNLSSTENHDTHSPLFFINRSPKHFKQYNTRIAKEVHPLAAIMLGAIVDAYEKFVYEDRTSIINPRTGTDHWFYFTIEDMLNSTGLTKDMQATALNKLLKMGFVEQDAFGLPNRRYFRLNVDKILEYFGFSKIPSSFQDSRKLDGGIPANLSSGFPQTIYKEKKYNKEIEYKNTPTPLSPSTEPSTQVSPNGECVSSFSSHEVKQLRSPVLDNRGGMKEGIVPTELELNAATQHNLYYQDDDDPVSERKRKSKSSKKQRNPDEVEYAPNVWLAPEEHEHWLKELGEEHAKGAYEYLSDWKISADPKKVQAHSSDHLRLKRWAKTAYLEQYARDEKLKAKGILKPISTQQIQEIYVTKAEAQVMLDERIMRKECRLIPGASGLSVAILGRTSFVIPYTEPNFRNILNNIMDTNNVLRKAA